MANEKKFAVLIDADNVSGKYIKLILDEVSNDGIATYKRIYGDWTKPALASWKNVLLDYSVIPVQQYSYTTGKNATDSAMIIDAMDILYSGSVDGFCLVSSDSDFTRLASRLRESGMTVIGMGESKTPNAFIAACHKFKYLDVLAAPQTEGEKAPATEKTAASLKSIRRAVLTIVRENSDEEGWAFISDVGNVLIKRYPDFDVRNYGFAKFTPFIKSMGVFESRTVIGANNAKLVYIRDRNQAAQLAQKAALDAAQHEAEASARAAGILLPEEDVDKPNAADVPELSDAAGMRDSAEIADIASDVAIVAAAEAVMEQLPAAVTQEPAAAEEPEAAPEIVVSTEIPAESTDENADGRVEKVELVRGTPGRNRSRRRGGRRGHGRGNSEGAEEALVAASVPESAGFDVDEPVLVTEGIEEDIPAEPAEVIPAAVPADGENSGENGENSGGNPGVNGENSEAKPASRSRSRRRGRRGGRGKSSAAAGSVETAESETPAQAPVEETADAEAAAEIPVTEEPAAANVPKEVVAEVPAPEDAAQTEPAVSAVSAAEEAPKPRRRGRPRKTEAEKEADRLKKAAEKEAAEAAADSDGTEKPKRASRSRKAASETADEPKKATRTRRRKAESAQSAPENSTESSEPVPAAEGTPETPAQPETVPEPVSVPVEPEQKEGNDA